MRSTNFGAVCLSLSLLGIFSLSAQAQPTVISADPLGNPGGVYLMYSAPMDPASATNLANYALVNSSNSAVVPISGARLEPACNDPSQTNVFLQLGVPLEAGTNYNLTISNVRDANLTFISPNPTVMSFYLGGPPGGTSFTFDDGLAPTNTSLATLPALTDSINAYQAIGPSGGFNGSGCLVLVSNMSGQTYGQWQVTNDLANGSAVSSFTARFKFWNVDQDTSGAIGNGLVFHVGPRLPSQYTGGGSSWGNGLDLNFRNFANNTIPMGVNIWWYPPYSQSYATAWPNQGGGGTIPSALPFPAGLINLTTNWTGYIETNRTSGSFSNCTYVEFSVNNGVANLICSNASAGSLLLFSNVTIPTWTPITGGSAGVPASFGFTATDGSGNHQLVVVDDVDLTVNGVHVAGNGTAAAIGPVGFRVQPLSVTTNENVYVNFSVVVTGAPPAALQWYSNDVAIPGATSTSYRTPLTLFGMNNTAYKVVANNCFSTAASADAILTVVPDTNGVQVLSVGSMNGSKVGVTFSSFVDLTTAGNPANYLVNGVQPVSATVRTAFANYGDPVLNYPQYLKTVSLTPASPVSGTFTVTVKGGVLSRTLLPVSQTNLNGTVAGLSDADLGSPGTDPVAAGETFVGGTGLIELIAGGGDFLPIATVSTDRGHFAYLSRTGNFDMIARLDWETRTANAAKAGMLVRSSVGNPDPSDGVEPTIALTVFPQAGRNTYETGARLAYNDPGRSWAAPGVAANGNVAANWSSGGNWMRIRRLGPYFMGYVSASAADGSASGWNLIGITNADAYSFPAQEWVGLVATAANNDGRLTEADFSNWGPMTFATASVTITNNLRSSPPYVGYENSSFTFSIAATVTNAPLAELVYQWQRKGPSDSAFADIVDGTGNTNLYLTPRLTVAGDNGAQYRCIAYVGDLTTGHGATSTVATLSVLLDTNAPYMTAAAADATGRQITITFDGPMDYFSLADVTHYILAPLAGGPPIAITQLPAPIQNPDYTYSGVVVTLDTALSPGAKYLLTATNVLDSAGNNINLTTVPGGRQRAVSGWVLAYGYLKYERWTWPTAGVTDVGSMLSPGSPFLASPPTITQLISYSGYPNGDLSAIGTSISDFGARISGFFVPPANGNYQWYVRGNDGCAIWVSADGTMPDPTTSQHKAAYNHAGGFAAPGGSWAGSQTNLADIGVYSRYPDTSPITMTAGQLYGLTTLEKQGTGTSFVEFTYGTDGATVKDGSSVGNTAGSAYPNGGTAPQRGGAPTNTYNIAAANIATYVNPDVSVITATGPTNTSVEQGRYATFTVSASAVVSAGGTPSPVPVGYQWMKNGANLPGATNSTYTTPAAAYPGDNGATFAVALSVRNLDFMTITNSAVLTVYADTNAPMVISASSFAGSTISILYDWLMDPVSAAATANYTAVSGGLTVTKAELRPDNQTVLLHLSGTLAGPTFSVTINNVKDLAGNAIAPNTVATGSVLFAQMSAIDIGVGTNALGAYVVQTNATLTNVTFDVNFPGSTVMAADGSFFEVQASGQDIGNQQDGQHFVCEQRTGDFDIKVRVDGLTVANNASKAGLMLRESLAPGSRRYNVVADPPNTAAADGSGLGLNKVEVTMRTVANGASATWGNNPAPANLGTGASSAQVPGLWLRLKLVGRTVYAFTGADGVNWALAGRENLAANWPLSGLYVGMCVSARNTNSLAGAYTAARFSNYGDYTAPATRRALFLIGDEMNVPAGAPNATPVNAGTATPQQASDTRVWNTLIAMGYNVTAIRNETFRPEDTEGVSVVLWSSTGNSGGTGNPSSLTTIPVPLIVWESSAWGKLKMASADGSNSGTATQVNITNTAPPTASVLAAGLSGGTTVFGTADINSRAAKSTLGSGAVIVAQQASDATYAVLWGYEKGAAMTGANIAPHRRLAMFVNDTGPANLNANGFLLFTNAITWASVKNDEAPTILTQPSSLTVAPGSTAMFLVTAAGGSGPYTYQWARMVDLTPVDIIGATNRDYTVLAATPEDAGGYVVKITAIGSGLSVTSAVANLNVINTTPAPVAWGFTGGNLNLSWPADHLGWRLVVQTNTLATGVNLGGTWYTWPGSAAATSVSIAIDTNAPTVFYRLVYP